jgi:hypothetical protein
MARTRCAELPGGSAEKVVPQGQFSLVAQDSILGKDLGFGSRDSAFAGPRTLVFPRIPGDKRLLIEFGFLPQSA